MSDPDSPLCYGAFTVSQFCHRYNVSRAKLYVLWTKGLGPRYKSIGGKRLIGYGQAEEWINSDEVTA